MTLPLIYGHRGASAHAPENTLAAFLLAQEMGADGVELDAKLSQDGHVMVIHDPTVNRTTHGAGKVSELTLKEIQVLDAGYKFHSEYPHEKIPTLDQVFEAVGGKLIINVELTNYSTPGDDLPEKVAELVVKHHLEKKVIFSSFSFRTIKRIQGLLPEIPAGILALPGLPGIVARSSLGRAAAPRLLHPHYKDASSSSVSRAHLQNRGVNVWTVNDPHVMKRMIAIGVDGIITDDVPSAVRVHSNR